MTDYFLLSHLQRQGMDLKLWSETTGVFADLLPQHSESKSSQQSACGI
jgi:hypothetical protein